MNIYVGNLSYSTTEDDLRNAFEAYGQVNAARVMMDRETGKPRGFGFVEMADANEAQAAIAALNGQDLQGRTLKVNEARPQEDRRGGGGGGGRGGYGSRGGGGGGGGYGSRW
ncbi:MAG TPA: RNA-binding protein [Candidatus Hydrogenedentes bacterium]|nr:RNA-binding protein [Candidatus Hydrogenedentota bacterium]HOS01511.1 RNA-binding protein [Candidatus Hydrogenedentota bacterium]